MEQAREALREKLEAMFLQRAAADTRTERMSLGELLYHALVESGLMQEA